MSTLSNTTLYVRSHDDAELKASPLRNDSETVVIRMQFGEDVEVNAYLWYTTPDILQKYADMFGDMSRVFETLVIEQKEREENEDTENV